MSVLSHVNSTKDNNTKEDITDLLVYILFFIFDLVFVTRSQARVTTGRSCECTFTEPYDALKIKCTLVQALRLCTGRTATSGSRGIALLFLDNGTRRGWGVSVTPRPLFTPGKDPVPVV